MDELIARIEAATELPRETAESAVRIILNFLHADGPTETVEQLATELGAAHYLAEAPAKRGLFGNLFGGGAMAAFSALTAVGLDMDQMQTVVKIIIDFSREKVGDPLVDEVIAAIPGLQRLI